MSQPSALVALDCTRCHAEPRTATHRWGKRCQAAARAVARAARRPDTSARAAPAFAGTQNGHLEQVAASPRGQSHVLAAQARWSRVVSNAAANGREPENTIPSNGGLAVSNAGWLKVLVTKVLAMRRVTLDQTERCVLACVLTTGRPCTSEHIAVQLGLETDAIAPVVDGLVQWRILTRTAEGFALLPDAEQWGPPPMKK